jgi:hypothetical protein
MVTGFVAGFERDQAITARCDLEIFARRRNTLRTWWQISVGTSCRSPGSIATAAIEGNRTTDIVKETSQKCAKGIHLTDLAKYLDARVEAARKEMTALTT